MRGSPLLATLVALTVAGCATLGLGASDEEVRLETGLEALARGDWAVAREHLAWVARTHADEEEGRRAMLALAAADLDPRNPSRRLAGAAEHTDRYLALEETPPWTRPVAESLYLVASELGAMEDRTAAVEAENRRLRFEGSTVPQRLRALETARDSAAAERDRLRTRVGTLEGALATRNDSIGALNKEIERIKKLIKP